VETKVGRLQSGKAIRLAPLGKEKSGGRGTKLVEVTGGPDCITMFCTYFRKICHPRAIIHTQAQGFHLDIKPQTLTSGIIIRIDTGHDLGWATKISGSYF
jgi:hypothetical protein